MKRTALIITAAVVGISALAATATLAHDAGHGYGQGMGQGMGLGMGPGMMQGPGAMQGQGMMQGHGYGPGQQDCLANKALDKPLTVEDVRANLQAHLDRQGNDRLKVGKIVETNDKTIAAEIVTIDNSLVHKIEVDKTTGRYTPVK